jgi:serine/threonine protein kinase
MLKDANVLCSEDLSQIKLADFGASLLCDNQHAQTRTNKGTIDHLAPEVLLHADESRPCRYSFSVDMWAVGALLLRVAHGPVLQRLAGPANPAIEGMASAVASMLGLPAQNAFDPGVSAGLRLELLVPQPGLTAPVRPTDGPPPIESLITKLLDYNPAVRPTDGPPPVESLITKLLDYNPAVRPSAAACYAKLTGAGLDQPAPTPSWAVARCGSQARTELRRRVTKLQQRPSFPLQEPQKQTCSPTRNSSPTEAALALGSPACAKVRAPARAALFSFCPQCALRAHEHTLTLRSLMSSSWE